MDALYIHIPFCDKKCFYCDFWTFINMGHEIDRYTDYIIKESRLYPVHYYDTVYFGGGTPSLLSIENFRSILEIIKISETSEITVEINPKNLSFIVKSNFFTNQVDINSKGMSYPAINSTDLSNFITLREALCFSFKKISLDIN